MTLWRFAPVPPGSLFFGVEVDFPVQLLGPSNTAYWSWRFSMSFFIIRFAVARACFLELVE